jgi:uncharacterized cupredoxin-like copper-binding protein
MKIKRTVLSLAALIIMSLLFSACASVANASGTTNLSVDLTDFAFKPNTFKVPAGKEIAVKVTNKGANVHEFVIMKAGTKVEPPFGDKDEGNIYWEIDDVQPGQTKSDKFTAPAPGEYQVVCGTAGHIEMGMIGTLTVVQ